MKLGLIIYVDGSTEERIVEDDPDNRRIKIMEYDAKADMDKGLVGFIPYEAIKKFEFKKEEETEWLKFKKQ